MPVRTGQPFDGLHRRPVGLDGEDYAGTDRHSVQNERAGAALAVAAAMFGAGEADPVADEGQQRHPGGNAVFVNVAVNRYANPMQQRAHPQSCLPKLGG